MLESSLREDWAEAVDAGDLAVGEATRAEILYRAHGPKTATAWPDALDVLCELAAVPRNAWRWVEAAQHKLTLAGQRRSAGPLDLLVAATAVHHSLTIVRDDKDYTALARVLAETAEHRVADDRTHQSTTHRPARRERRTAKPHSPHDLAPQSPDRPHR
jgi:predicted nucleic acid-binding protein